MLDFLHQESYCAPRLFRICDKDFGHCLFISFDLASLNHKASGHRQRVYGK